MVDTLVATVFAVWLVATVVAQFRTRPAVWLQRHDWFNLLPRWTFFAPNPGRSDLHVLYRDRFADGSVSAWTEMDTTEGRTWLAPLWNPGKRRRKAVHDAMASLRRIHDEVPFGAELMVSRPYLLLLSMVCGAARDASSTHRQFVVVATEETNPAAHPKFRVKSAFHPL